MDCASLNMKNHSFHNDIDCNPHEVMFVIPLCNGLFFPASQVQEQLKEKALENLMEQDTQNSVRNCLKALSIQPQRRFPSC
jgi:hypothetical protein